MSVAAKLIPLEGVRWIFPNAPSIPVAVTYNQPTPAWYNIEHFAETLDDLWDDSEGIMRSTSYIASMIKDLLAEGIPSEKIIVGVSLQGRYRADHGTARCGCAVGRVLRAQQLSADAQSVPSAAAGDRS